jgi:hypothetical protein
VDAELYERARATIARDYGLTDKDAQRLVPKRREVARMDATDRLRELQGKRDAATSRVDELEREWRTAVAAAREASAALTEGERHGLASAKRRDLEKTLAAAKARADEPWKERVDGGKRAVRDRAAEIRTFVAGHFPELVADIEEEGQQAAETVNTAAAALIAAHLERERIAAQLGQLLTQVQPPSVGDVSYTAPAAEQAARAAAALVAAGGEVPVRLRRDTQPWAALLGEREPEATAV